MMCMTVAKLTNGKVPFMVRKCLQTGMDLQPDVKQVGEVGEEAGMC